MTCGEKWKDGCRARAYKKQRENSKYRGDVQRLHTLKQDKRRQRQKHEREMRGTEIIQLFLPLVNMTEGGKNKQEAKQPQATIPPLVLLLFFSSSPFVFGGIPHSHSFIFTPAMGLVTGRPLHDTVQNTHSLTHTKKRTLLQSGSSL